MVNAIPKWVWNRYALLWKNLRDKPFTFEEAQKLLKYDDRSAISVMFLELRKAGWLNLELSKEDARKRVYTLVPPTTVVEAVEYDSQKHKD